MTWNKLPADGDNPVTLYRVQAYTGTSVDVATGVRVGDPVNVAQPTDAAATEVVRRMAGLTNGTTYKFSVAARYGTVFSNESALSAAVAPEPAAAANAGPDQSVLRNRIVTLDGSASPKVTSYQWTQIRPRVTNPDGTTLPGPAVDGHRRHQRQAHLPVPAEVVREVRRQLLPVPADDDAHQR